MPKTDLEQLKGILEEFDKKTIFQAMREQKLDVELAVGQAIKKTIKDFPKFEIGPRAKEGDEHVTSLEAFPPERSNLEALVLPAEFLPVHFLEEGAVVQRAVARVNTPYGFGSGFLVSPSLFMTNNHVIPNIGTAKGTKFEFNYQLDYHGNPVQIDTYYGDPDNFFHTNSSWGFDYTILRLKPHSFFKILPYAVPAMLAPTGLTASTEQAKQSSRGSSAQRELTALPFYKLFNHAGEVWGHLNLRDVMIAKDQRVNIIQHPAKRRKEVCLHDNRIMHIYNTLIRYRTDTEPGSSGSPVLDNEWELVAIHHAAGSTDASGNWINNEGIRIDKIIDDLQNALRGTADEGILTELGIP